MYRGFAVSLLMHAGLLVWALVSLAGTKPHASLEAPPVEVSIISVQDLETRQRKGDSSTKIVEAALQPKPATETAAQEAPKPRPAPPPPAAEEAPPPPAPEAPKPATAPPSEEIAAASPAEKQLPPEPKPDEIAIQLAAEETRRKAEAEAKAKEEARAKAEAEAKARAEAKAKAEARAKAEAERRRREAEAKARAEAKAKAERAKQFDPNQIAALIDKSPDKRGAPPPKADPPAEATKARGPVAGSATGTDRVNTAREEDMLKGMINQALRNCWRLQQPGLPIVTVSWKLRPDGSLAGEPQVMTPIGTPEAAIAARAALAAVQKCSPFKLPPNTYALWRDITWDFDPSRMQ